MAALVTISAVAQKQFVNLPNAIKARVSRIFERLENWPSVSGSRALRGKLAGHYRIRTGDYRVQFSVTSADKDGDPPFVDIVEIEKIGHRDRFYDE